MRLITPDAPDSLETNPAENVTVGAMDLPNVWVNLRAGDNCPRCHAQKLDYNGLLNLACRSCGFELGGCFT